MRWSGLGLGLRSVDGVRSAIHDGDAYRGVGTWGEPKCVFTTHNPQGSRMRCGTTAGVTRGVSGVVPRTVGGRGVLLGGRHLLLWGLLQRRPHSWDGRMLLKLLRQ